MSTIRGYVTDTGQPMIELVLVDATGKQHRTTAMVDTGFNSSLILPAELVDQLGLVRVGDRFGELADGTKVRLDTFEGTILWYDNRREVLVLQADGGALVGMLLLRASRLTIDVPEGGEVRIEPLDAELGE